MKGKQFFRQILIRILSSNAQVQVSKRMTKKKLYANKIMLQSLQVKLQTL